MSRQRIRHVGENSGHEKQKDVSEVRKLDVYDAYSEIQKNEENLNLVQRLRHKDTKFPSEVGRKAFPGTCEGKGCQATMWSGVGVAETRRNGPTAMVEQSQV
jgi:hypothetical protein